LLQPLLDPAKRFWDYIVVEPSYVIFKIGNTILAKNGSTGEIEFRDEDASSVIQSAINALGTEGGKIFIKAGTYSISKTIDITRDNVKLCGSGPSTILEATDGSIDVLQVLSQKNVIVENLFLRGVGAGVGRGLYLYDTEQTIAREIYTDNFEATNLASIFLNYCRRTVVENPVCLGANKWRGIQIYNSSHCVVRGGIFYKTGREGAFLHTATNCSVEHSLFNGCGHLTAVSLVAYLSNRCRIEGNIVLNSDTEHGLELSSGSSNLAINNVIEGSKQSGIYLIKEKKSVVACNMLFNNTHDGILLSEDSDDNLVELNSCDENARYGIQILTTDCDRNWIKNNHLTGNISGAINDLGTDTVIKSNKGYVTENSGITTITGDGTTTSFTVDVTHGLVSDKLSAKVACKKPATYKLYLVDTDADGTYETLRIEITFDTAPASGETVEIYWEASVV